VDCTDGIFVRDAHDINRVYNCEVYPFVTSHLAVTSYTASAAADNGSGLWRLTIPTHTLQTGDAIGINGANAKTLNGRWTITVINSTTIDLQGSSTAPATTASTTISENAITVASTNNFAVGQTITGTGIPGSTTITAIWRHQNKIFLSANATATGAGVAVTATNPAVVTPGTVYYWPNRRTGMAYSVTDSEAPEFTNCFSYGWKTGFYIGADAPWCHLINCGADSLSSAADPEFVGVWFDGSSHAGSWVGGWTSSQGGSALRYNATGTTATTVMGITLNTSADSSMIEQSSGRLVVVACGSPNDDAVFVGAGATSFAMQACEAPSTTLRAEGATGLSKVKSFQNGTVNVLALTNYADDTAAAAAGVPVGGLYKTSGTVKVRVT
jgi:hypothetical protein